MGKVVAAIGQSHILMDDHGVEKQAAAVFDGFKAVGDRVGAANPDVIVIISDDHMFNITSAVQVPLAVSTGETLVPFGDMELPQRPYRGHGAFGDGFIRYAAERGFDIARLEEEGFRPDHGVVVPLMFINPTGAIPTVVINVNINMEPQPTPLRCWNLGIALKEFIREKRPAGERVAVIGTGGLSHWLNIEGDGQINAQWDEDMLALFARGDYEQIIHWSNEDIAAQAGNGGVEIINWLMMAATTDGAMGEKIFYEPLHAWKTGMGAIAMHIR